ncbi:CoA transferase [Microbacterium gilvum]|uniref:CoA transferase n=1 Tax=Microbacterium gilvum TaxID=1336204 RepID=A0ABP8ZSY8_9MICO
MAILIRRWWDAPLDVEGLAIDAVSEVVDAVARLVRAQGRRTAVDTTSELVRAAFESVEHIRIGGRPLSPWAEMSGFFRAADGHVRLHGNYPHHADAIRRTLGASSRSDVEAAIGGRPAHEVEDAIVAAGGVAAAVRSPAEWRDHAHERATGHAPWAQIEPAGIRAVPRSDDAPLAGVRVLDLTRVIAGPACAQLLACLGADVLRVDPPHRPELPWQYLASAMGKRSAVADLGVRRDGIRALLDRADVVLLGYRPGALDRFGLSPAQLAADHPRLVVAALSAWGADGPWGARPGFDSIVQAATGIAVACADADGRPGALPVQALDFATGYRMAAGVVGLLAAGRAGLVRTSLVGAARTLLAAGPPPSGGSRSMDTPLVTAMSPDGPVVLPPPPVRLDGATLARDAGGYGTAPLTWGG